MNDQEIPCPVSQGDMDGARVTLDHCLAKDTSMPEAHLLLAQVASFICKSI